MLITSSKDVAAGAFPGSPRRPGRMNRIVESVASSEVVIILALFIERTLEEEAHGDTSRGRELQLSVAHYTILETDSGETLGHLPDHASTQAHPAESEVLRMRQPTTSLEEIASLDVPTIRPVDVAKALGIDPYCVNLSFKNGTPMFPGFMSGNRVHILRVPFLKQMGYYDRKEAQ